MGAGPDESLPLLYQTQEAPDRDTAPKEVAMRHLMSPMDLSVEEINRLMDLAADMKADPDRYAHSLEGKILATCFYEPSTRTRLSFESAMLHLGGKTLGFASANSSSAAKGESVADTIRVISSFADICAMRHPKEGAPLVASLHSEIPVINAGDGGHQHPTQTLTDLFTIHTLRGSIDHLVVGLCGDLKFGRTVHSLITAMSRYEGISFVLISPPELRVPGYIREDVLEANHIPYREVVSLDELMPELDILYMTRVQKERFFNEEDYLRMKDFYILTPEKMKRARKDMFVLHPLPRVNEISVEVDQDPRAAYFRQVECGRYIRQALILSLLGKSDVLGQTERLGKSDVLGGTEPVASDSAGSTAADRPFEGQTGRGCAGEACPGSERADDTGSRKEAVNA